ncbi:MAG: SDR family oxidoreductase [Pseudomonadales bacterium]|nr:SDR family oxidoreductase [Pseudomonadales bacterium]
MTDPQTQHLEQQLIWITGASSGIGEALAHSFAARGTALVLSARREPELQRVRQHLVEAGAEAARVMVLPLDVTDYAAMPAAVEAVVERFGRIDMLINNAGISQRSFCVDTDMAVYRTLFEVDVLGQIALTKQVLPTMIAQGSGRLVVTSSLAGKVGAPQRTGYCAAKHAVMGFFDALRCEVAHQGVRVSTVIPGFIRTNIARNALTGSGAAKDSAEADIDEGMDVARCAEVVAAALARGEEEIAVGEGPEMALLDMKRDNPTQLFRTVEAMAQQLLVGS